jgi:hypothetical protein
MDSHLPVLQLIADTISLDKTLEFGSGEYSTKFFLAHSAKHTSIEMYYAEGEQKRMDSKFWYEKSLTFQSEKYTPFLFESTDAVQYLKNSTETFDMIFVDADMRSQCVNEAFAHTETVVAHDTEQKWGQWQNVVMPEGWVRFTRTQEEGCWTTVWTSSIAIADACAAAGYSKRSVPRDL